MLSPGEAEEIAMWEELERLRAQLAERERLGKTVLLAFYKAASILGSGGDAYWCSDAGVKLFGQIEEALLSLDPAALSALSAPKAEKGD